MVVRNYTSEVLKIGNFVDSSYYGVELKRAESQRPILTGNLLPKNAHNEQNLVFDLHNRFSKIEMIKLSINIFYSRTNRTPFISSLLFLFKPINRLLLLHKSQGIPTFFNSFSTFFYLFYLPFTFVFFM